MRNAIGIRAIDARAAATTRAQMALRKMPTKSQNGTSTPASTIGVGSGASSVGSSIASASSNGAEG
jgi:hypothetical protein